ncbi:MAG: TonB family protein [Rhodoferax sp.]|nr:TonB family protein [Rhodoferax sp.]
MNLMGQRLAGLLLVLALHAGALYGLWRARMIPSPTAAATLFVNFIAPPDEKKTPEPQRPPELQPKPKQRPITPPQPRQLVAQAPVTAPTDFVAPEPPPKPEPIQVPLALAAAPAPMPSAPLPVGPVALSAELSVACPQRSAPSYPAMSRRRGEQGVVLLRVELSETGAVAKAWVQNSSGFDRLDEAALAAVRTWHCTPPTRNGQPERATALQPFNFVIQGN